MMVEMGDADAMISGLTKNYPDTIRPALHVIGTEEGTEENCRHVFDVDKTRTCIFSRYYCKF
jgi:phosphotransacetylase